jgi:hypothetical protein
VIGPSLRPNSGGRLRSLHATSVADILTCRDRGGFGVSDGCGVVGVVFDQVWPETSTTAWWRMPVKGNGGVDVSGGWRRVLVRVRRGVRNPAPPAELNYRRSPGAVEPRRSSPQPQL